MENETIEPQKFEGEGTKESPLIMRGVEGETPPKITGVWVLAIDGRKYCYQAAKKEWRQENPKTGKFMSGSGLKVFPVCGKAGIRTDGKPKNKTYVKRKPSKDPAKVLEKKEKYNATWIRRKRKHTKIRTEIETAKRQLEKTKALNERIALAPTTKELQRAVLSLFAESDFNPIKEMMEMVKEGDLDVKDKISLLKALADFYPKPKSLDITGTIDNTTTFVVQQFRRAPQPLATDTIVELPEGEGDELHLAEEYREFEEGDVK